MFNVMAVGTRIVKISSGLLLVLACQQAYAASFELHEQSTTKLGESYAGTASGIDDASTAWYNPAGLTELKNAQAVASGIYYYGNVKLYNATAKNNIGGTVTSSSTTRPASNAVIPGLFISANVNRNWSVGFSVIAPFGLNTRYSNTSIARYMATISKIETYDLSPTVAYKINNMWSLGAGFDAMRVQATIDSNINFGAEGYVNNYAHGWTYGYHVGVLFKPSCSTKMGLVYFSTFNPHLKGHVDTAAYPLAPAPTTLYADIKLPDRLVYSITQSFSDAWTGEADVEFVNWSRLYEMRIHYNSGAYSLITLNNKNSWRVALGANFKYSPCWMFKGGLAWDQSPVRNKFRVANLPDSDRYWLALGAKYKINKYISVDAAYAHLFFKSSSIAEVGVVPGDTTKSLYGNYHSSANLVGVQLTWNFV